MVAKNRLFPDLVIADWVVELPGRRGSLPLLVVCLSGLSKRFRWLPNSRAAAERTCLSLTTMPHVAKASRSFGFHPEVIGPDSLAGGTGFGKHGRLLMNAVLGLLGAHA